MHFNAQQKIYTFHQVVNESDHCLQHGGRIKPDVEYPNLNIQLPSQHLVQPRSTNYIQRAVWNDKDLVDH